MDTYIHMNRQKSTNIYICIHTHVYKQVYTCTCIFAHIHTYTHIQTHVHRYTHYIYTIIACVFRPLMPSDFLSFPLTLQLLYQCSWIQVPLWFTTLAPCSFTPSKTLTVFQAPTTSEGFSLTGIIRLSSMRHSMSHSEK